MLRQVPLRRRLSGYYYSPNSLQCVFAFIYIYIYDPLVSFHPVLFLPVFQTRGHIYVSALQRSLCLTCPSLSRF